MNRCAARARIEQVGALDAADAPRLENEVATVVGELIAVAVHTDLRERTAIRKGHALLHEDLVIAHDRRVAARVRIAPVRPPDQPAVGVDVHGRVLGERAEALELEGRKRCERVPLEGGHGAVPNENVVVPADPNVAGERSIAPVAHVGTLPEEGFPRHAEHGRRIALLGQDVVVEQDGQRGGMEDRVAGLISGERHAQRRGEHEAFLVHDLLHLRHTEGVHLDAQDDVLPERSRRLGNRRHHEDLPSVVQRGRSAGRHEVQGLPGVPRA
jgi:hypothetical protein